MTTPLIRQLRINFSNTQIDYCVSKSCKVALEGNINLNNIYPLDDDAFTAKGVIKFIKFILHIKNQYDYIFILGKNWLINLLCKLSAANLIGFARESISRFILDGYVIYNDIERYQVLYYLDLLKVTDITDINVDEADIKMDLYISNTDRHIVDNELSSRGINDFVVVTNSGGNNKYERSGVRMLPFNKIIELLEGLVSDQKVVLLGSDTDMASYNLYESLLSNSNLINWAGKFSLPQSCYLISKCSHFYVTDCGVMHLGLIAEKGADMTCFFGPTNPLHVLPAYSNCKVYWGDEDIYCKDYQLYGSMNKDASSYFKSLDINEIL